MTRTPSDSWLRRLVDRVFAGRRRRRSSEFREATRPPRCIDCGYNLTGLPDCYTCPECGRRYTHAEIDAYFEDPEAFEEINRKADIDP